MRAKEHERPEVGQPLEVEKLKEKKRQLPVEDECKKSSVNGQICLPVNALLGEARLVYALELLSNCW